MRMRHYFMRPGGAINITFLPVAVSCRNEIAIIDANLCAVVDLRDRTFYNCIDTIKNELELREWPFSGIPHFDK
ncbi:hypothetical protein SAMN05660479_02470 [Microbulbifer thermotolerans]|uniref:Uncharacterized protein n=1 Tax=Microbulbifer thermotolerans TaxID=252514 RepID=A0A143HJL4_MICTH|nr:hypothetical protein [Microbulbifer thermotolerans]AMX01696.1 hypothetical protein A3224_03075 [Microbulbifer thermotolerans]SFC82853.1 hypothetical protein SAMN05660479_02470 [Microbulbifer thermotolerans]